MESVVNLLRENKYGDAAKACERIELEVSETERARGRNLAPPPPPRNKRGGRLQPRPPIQDLRARLARV